MSYAQKCEILNKNSMFALNHFQYRVYVFFTEILMGSYLLGEIRYHATRVELITIHSFLWILNPVKLRKEKMKEFVTFLDHTIDSFFPDQTVDKELYDLLKLYQTHQFSKSRRKQKLKPCRYNVGNFIIDKTIVAVPRDQSVDILEKSKILTKLNIILPKVKKNTDDFLDPSKTLSS